MPGAQLHQLERGRTSGLLCCGQLLGGQPLRAGWTARWLGPSLAVISLCAGMSVFGAVLDGTDRNALARSRRAVSDQVHLQVGEDRFEGSTKKNPRRKTAAARSGYDFTKGVRGKYAERYAAGTNIVLLEPDVAQAFPTARAVNQALRELLSDRHA